MNAFPLEQLSENEALLQGLLHNPLFGVYVFQLDRFLLCNPRLAEVFGYTQEEICSDVAPQRLVEPCDWPRVKHEVERRLHGTTGSSSYEFHGVRKDGQLIDVEVHGSVMNYCGKPAIIGILHDVTARKAVEKASADQLQFIARLVDTIPNPLFYKDERGRYLGCNAAFEQYTGLPRTALIGHTVHETAPGALAEIYSAADQALFDQPGTQNYETMVSYADGSQHQVIFYKATFCKADGSVGGLVGVILDITERKRMEDELRRSQSDLQRHQAHLSELVAIQTRELQHAKEVAEAANRTKSQFLSTISHELRTPMNGVMGMTDLALRSASDMKQRSYLEVVKSSASSLMKIISGMLDYVAIESGKLMVLHEPVDLARQVTEAVRAQDLTALDKDLVLGLELDPSFPARVLGDAGRWRQIVTILVENAIKFTPRGDVQVSLGTEFNDDRAYSVLKVTDSGIGMAPELQANIFTPFTQGDTSSSRAAGGTGIGLSLAYRLVMKMAGEILVESAPQRGTTFTVRVPQILANRKQDEPIFSPYDPSFDYRHALLGEDQQEALKLAQQFDQDFALAMTLLRRAVQENDSHKATHLALMLQVMFINLGAIPAAQLTMDIVIRTQADEMNQLMDKLAELEHEGSVLAPLLKVMAGRGEQDYSYEI